MAKESGLEFKHLARTTEPNATNDRFWYARPSVRYWPIADILAQRKIGVAGCGIRYAPRQIMRRWLMGVGAGFVRYLPFRIS